MSAFRITLAALGATVAVLAAGCGGGSSSVPDNAVAVVKGTPVPKAELEKYLDLTKKSYEANKRQFPKAGTPEYQSMQTQYVSLLVQNEEFRQAAKDLGITVTEKDVDKAEKDFIDQQFGGKRSEYEKALKQQGLTAADYRLVLARSALSAKLFEKVTKDVTVSDKEIRDYYAQNPTQYPQSRDVRHILIAETSPKGCSPGQDPKCKVLYPQSEREADKLYKELKKGASFAALAKKYSKDPGSAKEGGKLTIQRGQTVPEFEKMAFALKVGQISIPVKTQYGYHIIEALGPVKGNFESYKDAIRQTVLQTKRNDAMTKWANSLSDDYKGKVSYAAGFEPPQLPEVPTTASE